MSGLPQHLAYSNDHEWFDAATGRVGITAFAADALGDIVYLLLPEVGQVVRAGEPCGEVESTKSVSELYAPADGTVAERNETATGEPSLLNTDPYGEGWLYRIDPGAAPDLLSPAEYETLIAGGA